LEVADHLLVDVPEEEVAGVDLKKTESMNLCSSTRRPFKKKKSM
jgi:hypothetical protein